MTSRLVLTALLLAVTACNRDKAGAAADSTTNPLAGRDTARPSTPQGNPAAASPTANKAAPPPATKTAPAGGAATASSPLASAAVVLTVQVASFVNAQTAQSLVTRLNRAGVPAWSTTATVGGQEFTRVRVGAATNAADAKLVADKIRAAYHWPVWVTRVEDRSVLPADVLNRTRTYSGGT